MSNRRQFLQTLAGSAAGWSLAAAGLGGLRPGVARAADALTVTHLTDDLLLISGAGANVVALSRPEGVVLVDGGDAAHSAALASAIRQATGGRPVVTAFNTHWHWPHTGSNEALRKAGVKIIAQENTRLWLTEPVIEEWENRTYPRAAQGAADRDLLQGRAEARLRQGQYRIRLPAAGPHRRGHLRLFPRCRMCWWQAMSWRSGSYPILDYSHGRLVVGHGQCHQAAAGSGG